jgi:hypothetical protein
VYWMHELINNWELPAAGRQRGYQTRTRSRPRPNSQARASTTSAALESSSLLLIEAPPLANLNLHTYGTWSAPSVGNKTLHVTDAS